MNTVTSGTPISVDPIADAITRLRSIYAWLVSTAVENSPGFSPGTIFLSATLRHSLAIQAANVHEVIEALQAARTPHPPIELPLGYEP